MCSSPQEDLKIQFFIEDIDFKIENQSQLLQWLTSIIHQYNYELDELNYIFCSDEYLLNINIEYLNHNTFTDIITFDNSDIDHTITSDIFISIDRVKDNAVLHNTTFNQELYRVMIHGVLHLLGFKDKSDDEKMVMRKKENESLTLLNI